MSSHNLTPANAARQAKALDRPYRFRDRVSTFRRRIDAGEFAYRTVREYADGTRRHGLIEREHDELARVERDGTRGLVFAAYDECPKMVADYADTLPLLHTFGYDGFTLTAADGTVIEDAESTA